uniref:Uncharacterized protein n=1 Tax=Glossina pallidipes TaxID=7398 RepID=A0A1A9ZD88_GLOPL
MCAEGITGTIKQIGKWPGAHLDANEKWIENELMLFLKFEKFFKITLPLPFNVSPNLDQTEMLQTKNRGLLAAVDMTERFFCICLWNFDAHIWTFQPQTPLMSTLKLPFLRKSLLPNKMFAIKLATTHTVIARNKMTIKYYNGKEKTVISPIQTNNCIISFL